MGITKKLIQVKILFLLIVGSFFHNTYAQQRQSAKKAFFNIPESAKPWTFWYWMHGAVSQAGISADLQAMKEIGLGGAYLMPIRDTNSAIPFHPAVRQLTPEWWKMVHFAMKEAKRFNLKLAMHVSDGFALAGGPWITPEMSMQKIVWSTILFTEGQSSSMKIPQPTAYQNYYKDIAVFAYPVQLTQSNTSASIPPKVTTSLPGFDASFLVTDTNKRNFSSSDSCWIQYEFKDPFTCRSINIRKPGTSFQSQRLLVQVSDDGIHFNNWEQMRPARSGWQDDDADNTYSIRPVAARFFRFVYRKSGTEPGSEDLDPAKWKPSLKIQGILLSAAPHIHQYEAKSGSVWRVAKATTGEQLLDSLCVSKSQLLNITQYLQPDGTLTWRAPKGSWMILRMGHTSTGHENETAGGGRGLECDKFNPMAVKLQFDNWFGAAFAKADPALSREVLKIFHVDSWEAGSQNWSTKFRSEFVKRRGYDPVPWLPCMAGVPIESAIASEKFLHDIRETIAELVNDVFYKTLAGLAHQKGCQFSAESVAPTMVSDGLLHYSTADIPMGEFWLNSPTHDKPNDMLDAVSGAHIYGKNIVQAEAFTTVRMTWNEHPSMLKVVQDRNYAMGANKLVFHVFAHNPFLDKKPGVTLDGVGLYFQRDQTWWKQGSAWLDYTTRCQALLQMGKPVVDIAVFTGEEVPRRSVLPDRLVPVLPGLFGKERVEWEAKRLANISEPLQNIPDGVSSAANMYKAEDWIDPLRGYQYDCLNPAVLKKATVQNGRIVLPGGANYGVLVLPGKMKMDPNGDTLSAAMYAVLQKLVEAGATVIAPAQMKLKANAKGKVLITPYEEQSLSSIGIDRDVMLAGDSGKQITEIAWTHRKDKEMDIYFIANQENEERNVLVSLRSGKGEVSVYNPVTGKLEEFVNSVLSNGRIHTSLNLAPSESKFIIIHHKSLSKKELTTLPIQKEESTDISDGWQVKFGLSNSSRIVTFNHLQDWSKSTDSAIRYYSGTVVYSKSIQANTLGKKILLHMSKVANVATVKVNGIDCGTVWTPPYSVDISKAAKPGNNLVEIAVTNTWHNALIGDHLLPKNQRKWWTTAPFRLEGKSLEKAGLLDTIVLKTSY